MGLMGAAAVTVGGSLIGGMMSSNASQNAANTQLQAAQGAQAMSQSQYNTMMQNLAPYRLAGNAALGSLMGDMNNLTAPFDPTMAQLEQTPGYQFNLQQGLESTQNGYAAKGLGVSGAALKGAANYASGLAQNTYAQQAQIYYANQQNAFNKLMGVANMGQNSAAQQGQLGQGYLNTSVNALTGGANAAAAGDVGSAGAWANAFGNISNTAGQFGMLQWMQQNGLLGANNTSGGSAQGMGGG